MKIECDKCAAKYSIADEKVRGKTFKIRCKKCSNVIIVRDKAAGVGALGAEPEAPPAVGWHLAINGETIGPMTEDEVRQRFAAGEIDRETAVWQEGFEDWLPLTEVDTFADLAGGAAAAEDPFASANQEEYARAVPHSEPAVVAAPVARAAGGGGAAVSEPSSPRVTRLSGQRNENSVLFSLDSLQALATGGGAANATRGGAPSRQGPKSLATQAPSSEGSGLIDIRSLGAMVGADAAPTPVASAPKADDAALPSFGGASLGGLASAPLVPQASAEPMMHPAMVAAAPPQRSNAPLYIMMVILLLAVAGLAAFIVLRPNEPVVVQAPPAAEAPSVKGASDKDDDEDKDKDDKDKDKDDKDKDDKDDEAKDEGADKAADTEAAADTEGGDAPPTDGKADPSKPKPKGPSTSKPSGSTPSKPTGSTPSKPTGTTPTPSKPSGGDNLDIDCILDPKLPKCKGGGGSSKPSGGTTAPKPADPSLPESLSTGDIKAGVTPVKDSAKACGGKHGAQPGETVKVKLSIAGATGAVTSASAEPPHQGTPLGNCVAAALKKATFKKFQKATLGAVYPVKM